MMSGQMTLVQVGTASHPHAVYTDSETNKKYKVVVIQAESAQGMNMYGAINLNNGSGIVSIDTDFNLLGKNIKK